MIPVASPLSHDVVGSGQPIVLLHGLTFDRRMWNAVVVDRLATDFRCITVDLPGHGTSPGPTRTSDEVAAAVHDLVRSVTIEPPVVVGHGTSALAALFYAESYPVAGLVAVGQGYEVTGFVRAVQSMETALRDGDFATTFEPVRRAMGVEELPEPLRTEAAARQVVSRDLVLGSWSEWFDAVPENLQVRIDGALVSMAAAGTPLLALFGRPLGDEELAHWARVAPSAQIEQWPDKGPLVPLSAPGRFATRLTRFAREVRAR